ncbi:MAG: hypothetical protein WAK60_05685, partial [Sedimentisphaerales bacterium]
MDNKTEKPLLHLKDFKPKSNLVLEDHTPKRARFPVVDSHTQIGLNYSFSGINPTDKDWMVEDLSAAIAKMDEVNIRCIVSVNGQWGDILKLNIQRYKEPYPDRFAIFAMENLDYSKIEEINFGEKWAKELEKAVAAGAQGMKAGKVLGLRYRDKKGKLIKNDDSRLDPIWETAGELGIPVLIAPADPVAFFLPLDETNERYEELAEHSNWHFYGEDFPPFMD